MSTVSVVIPCYNAEEHIGQALRSVEAQTRAPLEILVIDDRSTDGSADVVSSFEGVRLLRNPVNVGNGLVRNRALFEARGDLIAFLDADDEWLPHHLELVAGMLDEFPEAAVGFGAVEFFGDREGTWRTRLPDARPADAFWECLRATCVPQPTAVVRTSALASVGGYRQPSPVFRSAPDYDLWLRLAREQPFVATREVTGRYRWHPSQISQTSSGDQVSAVYESRWLLVHELRRVPGDRDPGAVARAIRDYWSQDYLQAYYSRDAERMRLLDDIRRNFFPAMRRPPKVLVRSLMAAATGTLRDR